MAEVKILGTIALKGLLAEIEPEFKAKTGDTFAYVWGPTGPVYERCRAGEAHDLLIATPEAIAKSIAAYERTVLSGDAPFDKFKAGDKSALSESAQRGVKLFFGAANCSACHAGPNFTDNAFHNIGVPGGDDGRIAISKMLGDKGAFKTPTLREIAKTAPYMHDGSLKTLEEVIAHYAKGGVPNPQLDEEMHPLKLSEGDIADLVTFLKEGLSSAAYPAHTAPELPQ